MKVTYDPNKNATNIEQRQLSFERAADFDFGTAFIVEDERKDYGEIRYRALGFLDERLHALVFTEIPKGIRVISFRKANQRERKQYEQSQLL